VATVDATTGLARFVAPGVVRFTATSATAGSATTGNVTVVERRYVASSSGYDHTCSVLSTGEAYCWGRGHEGQVGAAKLDTVCYDPEDAENRKKQCSVAPKRAETAVRFTRIAAGGQFSCGVATTQRAYCWGLDTLGQLGGGKLTATAVPSLVTSIVSFRDITAGGDHACGLTTVNTAFCWGSDVFGQLGNVGLLFTSSTPIAVDGELRFQQLSAGRLHTCGALVDGRVACWGSNFAGQVGSASVQQTALGPVVDAPQIVPLPVSASAAFAAQGRHSCALSTNGAAYCWGSNRHGELGTGARTTTDTAVTPPSQVVGGLVFAQLAGGFGFTCGVSAGNIYCWGRNDFGQTGNGPVSPTTVVLTPRQVATPVVFDPATGLTTPASVVFTSVTAGLRHACGQANDGALYCWGSDVMGALGSQQQQLVQPRPVRVSRPI
jgi:alpha-tubulin suppressor-like RCC1 family protein